jgi:HAE1 family hydrophobic/amphiphilic exporter-1
MHNLAALCVRRPVFASVLILSLVVVGVFSYFRLGVDRFPNVDFPVVTVTTVQVGASPEEIESEITDELEGAINRISGIDQLISISSEGVSVVTVRFELEKDGDVGAQEVRDKVNSVLRNLPSDAEPPVIEKIETDAAPILTIALSGDAPVREITEFADKVLQRQLEATSGVGQIQLIGGRERQINVELDSAKLAAVGLTPADVVRALRRQNVQIPGGRVEAGVRDLTLRTYGRVGDPQRFAEVAIVNRNGYTLRIGDVGTVRDSQAEVETLASVDGQPAVILSVRKQSGTNTVAVVDTLRARLAELEKLLPPTYKLSIVRDQSEYIRTSLHNVQEHLILGSFLATLIVLLFLHKVRPTLIAGVAIPASIVAAFAAMKIMGFTLNTITLLGLTLAVGIVIDDAVVVLENIFRFMEEKKMSPFKAAVEATREIGLAVTATSLSLIAVFLPIAFMGGIVGRFMSSFGVTMSFAILVSLLVSFTLTPMMAARLLRTSDLSHGKGSRQHGLYARVEGAYMGMLKWSMRHRWAIVLLCFLVFATTVPLFKIVNKNFLPEDDEGLFDVNVRAPEGSSVETTQKILLSISSRIEQLAGVEGTVVSLGADPLRTSNLGTIAVRLIDVEKRDRSQFDIMNQVRSEILPAYQSLGLRTQVSAVAAIGGGNNAEIQFWIGGPDLAKLAELSERLMTKLKDLPDAVDPDTNLVLGKPELGVHIDRTKAADLGVSVEDIATTLGVLVGGQEVTDYFEGGEQYEVHVRAGLSDRATADAIARAEVPTATGGTARLADVVTLKEGEGPATINRIARRRQVLISSNVRSGYSAQNVIDLLNRETQAMNLPPGYSYGLTGRSREQGKAAAGFAVAFLLSIVFMYLVLAAQFESWIHPVTILMALPMTVPFALLSLVVLNQSVNIYSALGILVLFGIVKKNGILQIDHMNGLRAGGMDREEAILVGNRDRLRPILMTTLAFVAGMIPLALSSGAGSGTNRTIASVIIGGQSLALLLTLLATPVFYSIFDDWGESRLVRRFFPKRSEEELYQGPVEAASH